MKNKLILLTLALFIFSNVKSFGQELCQTPSQTNNEILNKSALLRTSSNDNSYCLKIYFHVIRRSDGTGGQTVAAVNQAFQILNDDFYPHNISFAWDNSIDYIDDTSLYNSPGATIYSVNNHQDGIDIYLFSNDLSPGAGGANGIGGSSEMYVHGTFGQPPFQSLITSHIVSHEMGHVLFLWHTFRGTNIPELENGDFCPELVDGSNSDICGDYVTDTPADPNMTYNVDASCQWLGSGTDANGDSYDPDEQNIMSYSTPQCMSYFTPLQGLRMRNAIATLPFLQQTLESCCEEPLDLYIKDSPDDNGTEPNPTSQNMWTSQDIWIRNNDDGGLEHQNPEYTNSGVFSVPNYIYVKVINNSCEASSGNETLTINWAKANTALAWPQNWNGTLTDDDDNNADPTDGGGDPLGGVLSPVTIPALQSGEETIVAVPWVVPNPDDYSDNDDPWHFCLIARIDATDDPIGTYTSNPNVMVRNNNNQAWKNITVVDLVEDGRSGSVMIANPSNTPRTFFLELHKESNEDGKPIFDEAEVTIKMDDVLFNAWERGGKLAQELDPTSEEKKKLIKGDNVILDNIAFEGNEMGLLTLYFNFLTEELTDKTEYNYHVIQKDATTGEIMGGETYVVRKDSRTTFLADAGGDKEVDVNETIVISAEDINEPAEYNWYDSFGNLVYQGKDLTVIADVVKQYKLEVIAASDGFKDYVDVEVKFKPSSIDGLSPNPVSNNVTVNYKINDTNSAYLMVIGYYGSNTSNNYILDTDLQQTQIDTSNYPTGHYTVALVCDGEIVDAKTLIKQ
ncbi:hypothetical protein ESY86_19560 [Subsaximicrobium wynnwilliamsii]|uniref:Uncharacterized protein n=1 Tax=Subsaximicrobium wynnwilliamsii TaxID=291179 RepID=A0A5C6ZD64_9FLAO|nr:M43 family zinc metalloprotease [Subsaximicrobium wynnwilliamsii]TXD80997.1 hypothetical protein ESY87_19630 [Subsaximicrobium wynnwilliamsii]TXD86688.1 hypothetical protein ESY86_19560 [Subsaximicrobium wynnwilliamsii]TXE00331.1 hypothetical protein ESY88_19620 [Subsaximicrobium wynnwilliamsii]